MVRVFWSVLLLFVGLSQVRAEDATHERQRHARMRSTYERLANSMVALQKDGHWHGAVDADPSADALVLVLGKKLGLATPDLEREVLARIFEWQRQEGGRFWPAYPGGPDSLETTGTILFALQAAGVSRWDARVARAWQWFEEQGGVSKLNFASRTLLAMSGALPSEAVGYLSPNFFALPAQAPINIHSVGIGRTVVVPIAVWSHYRTVCELGLTCSPMDAERVRSGGQAFGQPLKGLPRLSDGINALKTLLASARGRAGFARAQTGLRLADRLVPLSAEFWAQEGLGWLLKRQQKDGTWGGLLQISMASILALFEAQQAGVGDFSDEIRKSWEGLLGWRRENAQGLIQQQITQGPVMDTARILTAQLASHDSLRVLSPEKLESAVRWLVSQQILEKGDWSGLAPELRPGGWAFQYFNTYYPDIDDTAMVIEALAKSELSHKLPEVRTAIRRGVDWVLGMQNKDGGFPVWDRGTSRVFNEAIELTGKKPVNLKVPRIADASQVDVSSRVLRMLVAVRIHVPEVTVSSRLFAQLSEFLVSKRVSIPGEKLAVWEGDWMTNYLYGTAEVVDSLLTSGEWNTGDAILYIQWLVDKQQASGGWGESNATYAERRYIPGQPTPSQTAMVLNALITYQGLFARRAGARNVLVDRAVERGVDYLLERFKHEAYPKEIEYTGIYAKDLWYGRYDLAPHYEAVRVLGRLLSDHCAELMRRP